MKAIILAGGSGSRLWPLSREQYPKQLLNINNNESLLQATYRRLLNISEPSDIVAITNIKNQSDVNTQLRIVSEESYTISEPESKNTAPAIASALRYFQQCDNKDDIVIIVPADHMIKNNNLMQL